jgi:hypothetical protein
MADEIAPQFNIHDAKAHLSRVISAVEHDEMMAGRAGAPTATVTSRTRTGRTTYRAAHGPRRGTPVLTESSDSSEASQASHAASAGCRD